MNKCRGCAKCVYACPNNVLVVVPNKRISFGRPKLKVLVANPKNCVGCNACVVSCPHHAIGLWRYNPLDKGAGSEKSLFA